MSSCPSGWLVHGDMGERRHPAELLQYVRMHRACQARMILGIHCNSPVQSPIYFTATTAQREEALSLVRRFAFVGLTDYWQESICLFHAMFGGHISKHEMDNIRY